MLEFVTYLSSKRARSSRSFPTLVLVVALLVFGNRLEAQNSKKRPQNSKKQFSQVARANPDLRAMATKESLLLESTNSESVGSNKLNGDSVDRAQVYPIPALETVTTFKNPDGNYQILKVPSFKNVFLNRRSALNQNGDYVFFTLNEKLQSYAEKLVRDNKAPHVALIAMEPKSGKILAIAEKSVSIDNLAVHAGFPAASLFKVVTTAAALDTGKLSPDDRISFRGGNYELSQANYLPSPKGDKRSMSLGEALGKSCNPVFGRVGLKSLSAEILERYALGFGFGTKMPCDISIPTSRMEIPSSGYELSRTAAGFGDIRISPVHAVTLMAGLVNKGLAKRPLLIDKIISPSGEVRYRSQSENWLRLVPEATARDVVNLMVNTTTVGTSRKEFFFNKKSVLGNIKVAGKTGTLKGNNPVGLNNWFIGAPVNNPNIAVAAIVVDPGGISTKASRMGRLMIQKSLE